MKQNVVKPVNGLICLFWLLQADYLLIGRVAWEGLLKHFALAQPFSFQAALVGFAIADTACGQTLFLAALIWRIEILALCAKGLVHLCPAKHGIASGN